MEPFLVSWSNLSSFLGDLARFDASPAELEEIVNGSFDGKETKTEDRLGVL